MPIWRSSELWTGRPGSPARRSSGRSAANHPNSSALPPLRKSTDGTSDEQQPGSAGPSPAPTYFQHAQRQPSGCGSINSVGSWEAASSTYGTGSAGVHTIARQVSRPESRGPAGPAVRANSYTVQYIGIANGELGILSQKQKLTIPVTIPGANSTAPPASNVVWSPRRRSAASGTSAASTRAPARVTAAPAATATAHSPVPAAIGAAAPQTLPPGSPNAAIARPPPGPSRPTSAMPRQPSAVIVPDPIDPGVRPYDMLAATTDDSDADSPASARAKPPSLASIVDDAHGQVKVISECFYSRALHSRSGPRDRHARLNRPMGPQVRDMDPLSTALPGCFAHRAPSAGGFPGWRLTGTASAGGGVATGGTASVPVATATGGHRRSYSGSSSGALTRQASAGRQQRAASAQPRSGNGAKAAPRSGLAASSVAAGTAAAAVAAAAAAVAQAARRPTDTSIGNGGDEAGQLAGAADGAAAGGVREENGRAFSWDEADYQDDD